MSRRKPSDNIDEPDSGNYYTKPEMDRFRGENPQKAKPMGNPIPGGNPNYQSSSKPIHATAPKGSRKP